MSNSSDGYVLVSKDGRSWSVKTYNKAANVRDMVWTDNRYLGVGSGIYTSTDGVSWKKLITLPNGAGLETIVYVHNMYVATGHLYWDDEGIHSVAYTSKDGITWKRVDLAHILAQIYTLYPVKNGRKKTIILRLV